MSRDLLVQMAYTMQLVVCLSLLKKLKTDSFCKYKINAFPGYLTAPRSFYFRQQFSELQKHSAYRITCCQKPITRSCRCEFRQGRSFH